MTTLTLNNRTFLFVPVPDEAEHLNIQYTLDGTILQALHEGKEWRRYLPQSIEYILIATTTDITEEQAGEIVDTAHRSDNEYWESDLMNGDWVSGYANYIDDLRNHFICALDSFASLLQHHSITGRHAIIEKI